MNKVYFLAPIVGLIIFGAIYWNFTSEYKQAEAAKVEKARVAQETKQKEEAALRKKAIDDALAAQASRKKEREAKEAKDLQEKDARQAAMDAREKAGRDADKLTKQVERLKKEIDVEKAALAKIEEEKKSHQSEETFLREYVKKAEGNAKSLEQVLNKIKAADDAKAAADAAAAAAAAKK